MTQYPPFSLVLSSVAVLLRRRSVSREPHCGPSMPLFLLVGIVLLLPSLFFSFGHISSTQAASRNIDFIIVVDNSGSMGSPGNGGADPLGLRYSAATMLIDLVEDTDRTAVVKFDDEAAVVGDEEYLLSLADSREELKQDVQDESVPPRVGAGTNYNTALDKAWQLVDVDSNNQTAVIFLTDGLPTYDPERLNEYLEPFVDAGIPVFLLLLEDKGNPINEAEEVALLRDVETAFISTGPGSIRIRQAEDIGEAFARILSALRPSVYIDFLTQADGTSGTFFTADSVQQQAVGDVTVVVSAATEEEVNATFSAVPPQANVTPPTGGRFYSVVRASSLNQPLAGEWRVDTSAPSPVAFALLRSDIQLSLEHPAPFAASDANIRYVPPGPQLLIVRSTGLSDAVSSINASMFHGSSCLDIGPQQKSADDDEELQAKGLGEDSFWGQIDMPSIKSALEISVGQLDQPFRLSRCYELTPFPGDTPPLPEPRVTQPIQGAVPQEGALPVTVMFDQLPEGLRVARVDSFVTPPLGPVSHESLTVAEDKATGVDNIFSEGAGDYLIRTLTWIDGVMINDLELEPIALLAAGAYTLRPGLSVPTEIIEAGTIRRAGDALPILFELVSAEVPADTVVEVDHVSVRRQDGEVIEEVSYETCNRFEIQESVAQCIVTIIPPETLTPGEYYVDLTVKTPETVDLYGSALSAHFTVPGATLELTAEHAKRVDDQLVFDLEQFASDEAVLSVTFTVSASFMNSLPTFNYEWELLRNEQLVDKSVIQLDIEPLPTEGKYRLSVSQAEPGLLEAGENYEIRLTIDPESELVETIEPSDTLIFEFRKPRPYLAITWPKDESFAKPIWPWGPSLLFSNKTTIEVPVTSFYMEVDPVPGEPSKERLNRVTESGELEPRDLEEIRLKWRSVGVNKENGQHMYQIELMRGPGLESGTYQLHALFPSVNSGEEEILTFRVNGPWNYFIRLLQGSLMVAGVVFIGQRVWPRRTLSVIGGRSLDLPRRDGLFKAEVKSGSLSFRKISKEEAAKTYHFELSKNKLRYYAPQGVTKLDLDRNRVKQIQGIKILYR